MNTMTDKMLNDFIETVLNEGNKRHNATAYDHEYFNSYVHVRVTFERNHKEQYAKLLYFCAEHDGIIISTLPATYETIVRVKKAG